MRLPFLFGIFLSGASASAAETVEVGVLRNEDIHVVQKVLYPKAERSEIGVHLGYVGFDAYVKAPNAQVSFTKHMDETLAFSAVAGAGWGLKSSAYRQLETPAYGVAPYATGYLASVLAGVEYAPIYAKLNLNGARIVHFDVYLALRAGLTVERSVLPDHTLAFAPTLSPALGTRYFLAPAAALHVALRDDLTILRYTLTQETKLKQNANVTVGLTFLSPAKDR